MKMIPLYSYILLLTSLLAFSANVHASTAPASIVGKKLVFSIPDGSHTYVVTRIFTDDSNFWEFEHENGDWEQGSYQWSATNANGTLQEGPYISQGAYAVASLTFTSSASGSFTYTKYKQGSSGITEIDYELAGTFVISDYSASELPSLDTYFSDDFSNVSTTQNYWYENTETSWYGLQFSINDGRFELLGTGTDTDELWFDNNSKSLVSVDKDWIIQGDAYANYPATGSENWHAKLGFEMEDSALDFELFIGPSSSGFHAHINYEGATGNYQSLSNSSYISGLKEGNCRVRNNSDAKTFYAEALTNGSWNTIMSVNWETGAVDGAVWSNSGSTTQLSNWVSMASKYVQPGMDFMIPSDGSTIQTLSANQLGFTSFSVSSDEDPMPKAFEDLSSEVSRVNALIAQSSSDPEANLLRGLYALLEFVELDQSSDSSLKDFAVSLGVEESIRNFVLSDVSTLENYNFDLSDSFQAKELAELFEYSLIPALESADAYFSKIGSNQTVTLSSEITGSDESITVDSADVYVLRSIVNILGGLASLQAAFDWNLNAGEIEALDDDSSNEVTAEKIRDLNSNFGGIRSASLLTKSKNFLKTAVETYALASPLLRASSRLGVEDRLFSLASEDLSEESDFKGDLDELYLALDSSHNLKEDGSTTDTLSLSNFFAGQVDLASLLPELSGDQFETDQVSDPTLGGLFPNWDQARISALMLDAELSIPQPTGWMWFDSYPWVYSHEENSWIYLMPYNSKLLYFSVKHNAWLEMSATSN
ncbi:MAG: hypothetical protein ACJZ7A_07700 [Opitutales bacterium]